MIRAALPFMLAGCLMGADPFKGDANRPELDGTPRLLQPEPLSPGDPVFVRAGVEIVVEVRTINAIDPSTSTLTLDGAALDCRAHQDTALRCTRTLDGTEGQGPKSLTGTLVNLIGNEARIATPALLTTDFTPPTAACVLSPAIANASVQPTLTVTLSEDLRRGIPEVYASDPRVQAEHLSSDGRQHRFRLSAPPDLNLRDFTLSVLGEDLAGNTQQGDSMCDAVDRTGTILGRGPRLDQGIDLRVTPSRAADGDLWAREGAVVEVRIATEEPIVPSASSVSMSGVALQHAGDDLWTHTLNRSDGEGRKSIDLTLVDAAGNRERVQLPDALRLDATPPTADCVLSPVFANAQQTILFDVFASEPLSDLPSVTASDPRMTIAHLESTNNQHRFQVMPEAGANFSYTLTATAQDRAGNPQADSSLCPAVSRQGQIQGIAPELLGEPQVSATPSIDIEGVPTARADALITLSLATQDAIDTGASVITLGGVELQPQGGGLWSRTLDGTEGDGIKALDARLVDAVGNMTRVQRAGVLRFDFTAPTASCLVSPNPANGTEPVRIAITPTEPLASPPGLTASGVTLSAARPEGSRYLSDITGPPLQDTPFLVGLTLVDLVGNEASDDAVCPEADRAGLILGRPPALSAPPSLSVHPHVLIDGVPTARAGAELLLTVATEPPLDVSRTTVTLSGLDLHYDPTRDAWTHTLDGTEGDGLKTLDLRLRDAVGNTTPHLVPNAARFDFTPPQAACFLAPPLANEAQAAGGVVFTLFASEPLEDLTVTTRAPLDIAGQSVADTTYPYLLFPTVSDADFLYTLTVTATDRVGNTQQGASLCDPAQRSGEIRARRPRLDDLILDNTPAIAEGGTLLLGANSTLHATLVLPSDAGPLDLGATTVSLSGIPLDPSSGTTYTRQILGNEGDGLRELRVRLVDDAGNAASFTFPDAARLDFLPPAYLSSTLSRSPAFAPADDGSGILYATDRDPFTQDLVALHITVEASEPLSEATLWLQGPNTDQLLDGTLGAHQASWTLSDLRPLSEGGHSFFVRLADAVGNTSAFIRLPQSLVLDRTPPASPPDVSVPQRIVHHRIPWGSDATARAPALEITGGAGAVPPSTMVFLRPPGADLLDATQAGPDGAFHLQHLGPDHPIVELAVADLAGNVSPYTPVRDILWTASSQPHAPVTLSATVRHGSTLVIPQQLQQIPTEGDLTALGQRGGEPWAVHGRAVWEPRTLGSGVKPVWRVGYALAYDPLRGVTLLAGGSRSFATGTVNTVPGTWSWDGVSWTQLDTEPDRYGVAMAFHTQAGHMLRAGHRLRSAAIDTATWDGASYTPVIDATQHAGFGSQPPPYYLDGDMGAVPANRNRFTMAHDAHRGETVLFGGEQGGSPARPIANQTWVWDGQRWQRRLPATSPLGRYHHATAYHAQRQEVFIFGGQLFSGTGSDTWIWDGDDWRNATPAEPGPAPASMARMAYDSHRDLLILHSGDGTWVWDDEAWVQRVPPELAPPVGEGLVFDEARGLTVLTTSVTSGNINIFRVEVWEFDGERWASRDSTAGPPARDGHVTAWWPGTEQAIVFGGTWSGLPRNDTWAWDGDSWEELDPATSPPARTHATLTSDESTGRLVLFGGQGSSARWSDTWAWTGDDWLPLAPSTTPPARAQHAATPHPSTGEPILFGGEANTGLLDDTWRFSGDDWVPIPSPASPAPRRGHQLQADPLRDVILLFGGEGPAGFLGDTWLLSGSTWTQVPTPAAPSPRAHHALAWDPERQQILLHGGTDGQPLTDTWTFDGQQWHPLPTTEAPGRAHHTLTYDPVRGRAFAFAGSDPLRRNDLTELDRAVTRGPAAQASVPAPTGVPPEAAILSVHTTWVAGGVGFGSGAVTDGASLLLWDEAQWKPVTQHSSSTPADLCLTLRATPDVPAAPSCATLTDPAQLTRVLQQAQGTLHTQLRPTSPNGLGHPTDPTRPHAELSVDYVEAQVRYRLAGE